jgi:hypothetical protein
MKIRVFRKMTQCSLLPIYHDAWCYIPEHCYLVKSNSADFQRPPRSTTKEHRKRLGDLISEGMHCD